MAWKNYERNPVHQDNAPAHTSVHCCNGCCTVRDCGFEPVDHPALYSPDLAPSDCFLFPNMTKHLDKKQYRTDDEVISAVGRDLQSF